MTEWARRYLPLALLVVIGAVVFFYPTFVGDSREKDDALEHTDNCIVISDPESEKTCVALELVETDAARKQGLSGRASMPEDTGMLFDFKNEAIRCMWMKDVQFGLDMIWLDASQNVVDMKTNIAPETFPERFCGEVSARYVIEVRAGVSQSAGTSVGQDIEL